MCGGGGGEVSSSRRFNGGGVEYVDEGEMVGPLATCQKERVGPMGRGVWLKGVVLRSLPLI